ncbi:pentatricopeptide repeat-containing protein At3g09040, mitochondrial-like [Selaginella moellendorffii]|uniref:pentatricopeptide repeat-containing protein At3g09040, mitochondrial-like n=1 Tax=Selaginella moellendorffii TaxID=88036 RepID=UPI000D1CDFEE|nr:pentatricopeptide repeat-containing protein At3g09040, mitochondrial-like [Selaginella moellendorffii]|eukprot:XP_024525815.1 pentatricopeptide repeat-containing protein At3g09040, mitochondrial-like [Selaginella moellendorffii]
MRCRLTRLGCDGVPPWKRFHYSGTWAATNSSSSQALLLSSIRALQACAIARDLELGRLLHSSSRLRGLHHNVYVANTLIAMYAKCGSMVESQSVFDAMASPDLVSWNALISGYATNGESELALELFSRLGDGVVAAFQPNARTFLAALVGCSSLAAKEDGQWIGGKIVKLKYLERAMEIHARASRCCDDTDVFVANALVDLYAKCGSLEDAKRVFFRSIPAPSVVSWTCLIAGCAENDHGEEALEFFDRMQSEGCRPNSRTFVAALTACSSLAERLGRVECLEKARVIHSQATALGYDRSETFVANSLVDVYSKLGSMADAQAVFDGMDRRDVVSWNSLMLGYEEKGDSGKALELFDRMEDEDGGGCEPNTRTLVAVLNICCGLLAREVAESVAGKASCLERVVAVHSRAAKTSCAADMFLANSLIHSYAKCGRMPEAREVFDRMLRRNVVSWTFLILGYVDNGDNKLALEAFASMELEKCPVDSRCLVAALRACNTQDGKACKLESLRNGMAVHSKAVKSGHDSNPYVASTLIDMYAGCGSMADARRVFDRMPTHDVVSWTALVLGFADNEEAALALDLFEEMETRGCSPNALTYVSALTACVALAGEEDGRDIRGKLVKMESLERGRALHSRCQSGGFDAEVMVANSLVEMYSKCGSMDDARKVFDGMARHTVVSWTVLILGYVENGENDQALKAYESMRSSQSCILDARIYVVALMACANSGAMEDGLEVDGAVVKPKTLEKGMLVHSQAAARGLQTDTFVANSLVAMYCKCGSLLDARMVFDRMPASSVVSWTALILAHAENAQAELALEFFKAIQSDQTCELDSRAYIVALVACGALTALEAGRRIHAEVCKRGFDGEVYVANALVDFYAKCGSMDEAMAVFDSHKGRNLVTWSALVAGYARQGGETNRVLDMFEKMPQQCCISSLSVLTACSHAGLVDRGKECFQAMQQRQGTRPWIEHYHCVIDMLGRANHLKEAMAVISKMPYKPTVVTWTTVLSACEKWKNVAVGRIAFESLLSLDENQPAAYVLMANIYKSAGMRGEELAAMTLGKRSTQQENA